jgi:phosphatidylserine/phosphatidylglycerophosphate/cardiolipin synthase-like enzyme
VTEDDDKLFSAAIIELHPYAVWTGSFNFSYTASYSFENAIYTNRPKIVQAYFAEWQQILAFSEPLDWTTEWVQPEWRIGS